MVEGVVVLGVLESRGWGRRSFASFQMWSETGVRDWVTGPQVFESIQ